MSKNLDKLDLNNNNFYEVITIEKGKTETFFHGSPYQEIKPQKSSEKKDWEGLYLTENKDHAKSYAVPKQVDGDTNFTGNGPGYVHEVEMLANEEIKLIFYKQESAGKNDEDGEKKAADLKNILNLKKDEPLLEQMGSKGMIYKGLEIKGDNEDRHEIIIPYNLIGSALTLTSKPILEIQNYIKRENEYTPIEGSRNKIELTHQIKEAHNNSSSQELQEIAKDQNIASNLPEPSPRSPRLDKKQSIIERM